MKRDPIKDAKANAKLDVRLPDQLKDEFLVRCREQGVSAGAVIRSLIIDYLRAPSRRWPAMAAGAKETLVKRAKWIAGGAGGAAVAGVAAMSVMVAPLAAAEDVDLDFLLTLETDDGSTYAWDWNHPTLLDDTTVLLPDEFPGSRFGIRVTVSPCRAESRQLARNCEVVLKLAVLELDTRPGPDGGVVIENEVIVAEPLLTGRFGAPMSAQVRSNGGAFRYALTARVDRFEDSAG